MPDEPSQINNQVDTTSFFKGRNKASVLAYCQQQLTCGRVLPQFAFTADCWQRDAEDVLTELFQQNYSDQVLIVRSSSAQEDLLVSSMAGRFTSVLDVNGREQARKAIDQVVASFGTTRTEDVVFVQPQLTDVICNGVGFTCDPSTGGPYYVFDMVRTVNTTAITSGKTNTGETIYVHRYRTEQTEGEISRLVALCLELEMLTGEGSLDIEFGIGADGELYLFQVRPLIVKEENNEVWQLQHDALQSAADIVTRLNAPHPFVHGKRCLLGVMPDWNPAEIIGIRPKALALSLYKELVTDRIWAYQRDNYGYYNLRSVPLLYPLAGCPYIDVRASFNSFVPKMINNELGARLVDYYMEQLEHAPDLHDKVEFEIILSCYVPSTPKRLKELLSHGFSEKDITEIDVSLRHLTNTVTHSEIGHWRIDLGKIEKLRMRTAKLLDSNLDPYSKIFWLAEDCKRYGTLPFAGLARAGFIAKQFLLSLRDEGHLSGTRYEEFMRSLNTVGSQLKRDYQNLSRENFLERYGHLRPGAYDIESSRYDEAPDTYFDWSVDRPGERQGEMFELTREERGCIQKVLDKHSIMHTTDGLFRFFVAAIEGREYAKFHFTRSVSEILRLIAELGHNMGYGREECSYINFQILLANYSYDTPLPELFGRSIEEGRYSHTISKKVVLPPLIRSQDDLWMFRIKDSRPNFITMGQTDGPLVEIKGSVNHADLHGRIAFIKNADPGHDWILGTGLKGFVTCYGGPNSHMAIRAAELGLPAVIGAGERLYKGWSSAQRLKIDCANQLVTVLA